MKSKLSGYLVTVTECYPLLYCICSTVKRVLYSAGGFESVIIVMELHSDADVIQFIYYC